VSDVVALRPDPGRTRSPGVVVLVRDVGALYLALLVVTALALLRPASVRPWVAGLAWLVFGVPHLVFHAAHAGPGDAGEVAALALNVLLAGIACLPTRQPSSMP
jgi:hypothetical protein